MITFCGFNSFSNYGGAELIAPSCDALMMGIYSVKPFGFFLRESLNLVSVLW